MSGKAYSIRCLRLCHVISANNLAGTGLKEPLVLLAPDWNDVVGGDAIETGCRPGSYDVSQSIWHDNIRIS